MFPKQKELLGRVLGPTKNEGNEMFQNVLTFTGHIAPHCSAYRLTLVEQKTESEIAKHANFDRLIKEKLENSMTIPPETIKPSLVDANDFDFDPRKMIKMSPLGGWMEIILTSMVILSSKNLVVIP